MNKACVLFVLTLMSVCCAVGAEPTAPQKATGKVQSYAPPKTPWGDPDLQGLWPGQQEIPLERDPSLGTQLYLTEEQAKARQARIDRKKAADEAFEGDGHIGFGGSTILDRVRARRQAILLDRRSTRWASTPING
jgi:hypothetical protein